jgi:hypothetical protein
MKTGTKATILEKSKMLSIVFKVFINALRRDEIGTV